MFIRIAFILAVIFSDADAKPAMLHVNKKDTGITFEFKTPYFCTNVIPYLKKNDILSSNVLKCDNYNNVIDVYVVKWLNVFEENGFNGSVPTFGFRKVSFNRNMTAQKDDKGNLLTKQTDLKDRKTRLTGKEIWKTLDLKDGDQLYKTDPKMVKNVEELKTFEIKPNTESAITLEEQNALYVTRAKN